MAKIRVYELARELNMTNKDLVAKLQDMEFDVKNHMSTITEETVSNIKSELYGEAKKDEVYEAKRIKPNVIRRRRRRAPEPEAEAEAPAEITPAQEAQQEEAAKVEAKTTETSEAAEASEDIEKAEAAPAEEKAPGEPETGKAAETPGVDKTTKKTEAPSEATPEAERPVEPEQPEEKPETRKKPAKAKPKKKRKKETPAKVIQMPETPLEPEESEEIPTEEELPEEPEMPPKISEKEEKRDKIKPAPPEPEEEEAGKKKGKRKKPAEIDKGRDSGKIKTALRRKEIVEGDALYDKSFGRGKKSRKKGKQPAPRPTVEQKPQITTPKAIKRRIKVDDTIVIADLAKRMGIKANELIKTLMGMGMMVTVNQTIDFETANLVAAEFNFEVERASFEEETILKTEIDDPAQMAPRPPVVTIMGHVDHGKTSLLDVIRRTKVTEGEAGGITQHIGAYYVELDKGEIVFLDTPGHEAFTSMRARGAQVTDIVVLVVAADDGVMPQTIEAIDHSRAAGVPIIVAVNKIDKNNAEPDRIKREIAEKGLVPEDWGGDTIFVNVSAKEQIGIDELLEMILLQSEVLELKANPNKPAKGHVIESKLDTGRGPVATLLVQEGSLKTGDPIVCGMYYGKIRAMYNDRAQQVQSASPSYPVEIVGLSGVPMAGDEFIILSAEKDAKQVSEHRQHKQRSKDLARSSRLSLDKLYEKMMEGEVKDLNLIIKADVQGSIEALKDSLTKLSTEEVIISVIHSAAGPIHESDVSLATVSNAIILGFNVRPSAKVVKMAEEENVDIRYYDVIYNAIKDIKDAMVGLMESKFEEKILGRAEVRQVFHVPNIGTIAGCYVTDGKIQRGLNVRLIREGIVTFDGKIGTLKRFKDDAKEVAQNYECGIRIENYNDIKVGDVLENYYLEEIKPEII